MFHKVVHNYQHCQKRTNGSPFRFWKMYKKNGDFFMTFVAEVLRYFLINTHIIYNKKLIRR